ncbi:MAG: DUF4823 domain-containing protein [Steroidobacteraceae bacterium]
MVKCILIAAGVLLVATVAGCSVPRSVAEGGPIGGHRVDPSVKVLILNVQDGQEQGQDPAHGSGRGVVEALRKQLTMHGIPLSTTDTMSLAAGLDEAKGAGFGYVCRSTITLWEDNATAWSGNGDKLTLSVDLYDAKTRELVAAATHRRVATGATLVSGSPDRFTDEVASGALGRIYGWTQH